MLDQFLCVSYLRDGTWVYHDFEKGFIKPMAFLPRLEDALVAEFIEGEAISLEGHMKIYGGLHLGYDRGDLLFLKEVENVTEWLEERALPLHMQTIRTQVGPIQLRGSKRHIGICYIYACKQAMSELAGA